MNQDATNTPRPPHDPIGPFDRRHFLRTAVAAGIATCCPGLHGIARADVASDQKARDLLKGQLVDPTPYAVVKDMDFRGATRMNLADLERHLDDREFMLRDHVKFFAALANGGKIARRKPSGELEARNGPITWMGGDGLPPDRDSGYFLSVRKTGRASITRIAQGNPTKPHAILDKSLTSARVDELDRQFNSLGRLYGKNPVRLSIAEPHRNALPRQTKLDDKIRPLLFTGNNLLPVSELASRAQGFYQAQLGPNSPYLGLVGWWATVELYDGTKWTSDIKGVNDKKPNETGVVKVPLGFLRVGELIGGKAKWPKGVPVSFLDSPANNDQSRRDGYTGDYDLHDAYLGSPAGSAKRRAFVSSPNTDVVTATPDRQPGETEYDTFTRLLNWSIHRTRMGQANQPVIFDGYANLVQHGAQNTYFAFISELYNKQSAGLLDKDEVEDLVQKLATWDDDIAFFANDGVVYTFDVASDPEPLKRFHQMYNLANCNNIAVSDKWGIWSNNQLKERIRKFAQGVKNQG